MAARDFHSLLRRQAGMCSFLVLLAAYGACWFTCEFCGPMHPTLILRCRHHASLRRKFVLLCQKQVLIALHALLWLQDVVPSEGSFLYRMVMAKNKETG